MLVENEIELVWSGKLSALQFDVNQLLELSHPAVFLFRLKSGNFLQFGFLSGDVLAVKRDLDPKAGDLLAVYLGGHYHLMPFDTANRYQLEQSKFFGVVIGAFRIGRIGQQALNKFH